MKSQTQIVNNIVSSSVDAAIAEARQGLALGAEATIVDLRNWPLGERNVETFRSVIRAVPGDWMFCLYRMDTVYGEDDEKRMETLLMTAEAGAAYVDVMADLYDAQPTQISYDERAVARQREVIDEIHRRGSKVIMSAHNSSAFLKADEVVAILKAQEARGADVVKLVARCDSAEELEEARRTFERLNAETRVPWIFLGSGKSGHAQRFLGAQSGCRMEFARITPDEEGVQPLIPEFVSRRG